MTYLGSIAFVALLSTGCSTEKKSAPFKAKVNPAPATKTITVLNPKATDNTNANKTATTAIFAGTVSIQKDGLFEKEFLYGADLQHSSFGDESYGEISYNQVFGLGHDIVKFRVVGDQLQLFADRKLNFDSDVNHPERLYHSFTIVEETDKELKIKIDHASSVLSDISWWKPQEQSSVRQSWVRSIEFAEEGQYLLIESSIETTSGEIAEHLETVFPRETLVKTSDKPFFMDAVLEPLSERYGFLGAMDTYRELDGVIQKLVAASRFRSNTDEKIKWYVTENAPDEMMPYLRAAVEGWNRYFNHMNQGDRMVFMGRLPANAKLGDPRYNVISWDSITHSGAAWESQAADPVTGIQSHSIIFLPVAWLVYGEEYMGAYENAEDKLAAFQSKIADISKKSHGLMRVPCARLIVPVSKIDLSGYGEGARDVLVGVLHHELGHALGLDHNFKGSEVHTGEIKTSSIMDYNHYQVEKGLISDIQNPKKGPMFEYDRQALIALYGADSSVLTAAPVIPWCGDALADDLSNGFDPLCLRYDIGLNALVEIQERFNLISKANYKNGDKRSIDLSVSDLIRKELAALDKKAKPDEIKSKLRTLKSDLSTLVRLYFTLGAGSLRQTVSVNINGIRILQKDSLPTAWGTETEYRKSLFGFYQQMSNMNELSAETETALSASLAQTSSLLQTSEAYVNADDTQKVEIDKLVAEISSTVKESINIGETSEMSKVRAYAAGYLKMNAGSPLSIDGDQDYEVLVLNNLRSIAINTKVGAAIRSFAERKAAVATLKTYKGIPIADTALDDITVQVKSEIAAATDAKAREKLRDLLKTLL